MKSIIIAVACATLLGMGCGETRELTVPTEPVELIRTAPLPPFDLGSYRSRMRLKVLVHILRDGTVEDAKMLESSGDSMWDSLAVRSIKTWRYAPVRRDGAPIDLWVRQQIVVEIQDPIIMTIGQIVLSDRMEADSVYAVLTGGTDLDSLFRQAIGTIDVRVYPRAVRDEVRQLAEGEYTTPLRLGEQYFIYKRFRKE